MEALAAASLAGNILQFIDFARTIVNDAKKFYEATDGAKEEYRDAQDYARRLQSLASRVMMPEIPEGSEASIEEQELKKLCERCLQVAEELLSATRGSVESSHHDWLQSTKKALKIHVEKAQIDSLQARLDRISQQLTSKIIPIHMTKVREALENMAIENRRLSSRRDQDIWELQKQLRHLSEMIENGISQDDTVPILSCIAETGAHFVAEQLILGRLFFHGMDERYANIPPENETTLRWILDEDPPVSFAEFLRSEVSLYWISGKPGSGKSTALKYICGHPQTVAHLNQWADGNERRLIVAKFFFWNAGRLSMLKSQEGLLRSIIHQILREAPELIPHVFPGEWSAYMSGTRANLRTRSGFISIAQLLVAMDLLCNQISASNIKCCLFIDGLDEYDGRPTDIIHLITTLKSSTNFKACVASRPWNEFENVFGQDQANKLYMEDLTRSDIRAYVQDTLENDTKFQELVEAEGEDRSMDLIRDIVNGAQGVFLWVRLVVRSLLDGLTNADKISYLQHRLRLLPSDLDELFERILFSIDEIYNKQAAVMCLVTLAARQTLPLMAYWFMDEENKRYAIDLQVQPLRVPTVRLRFKQMKKRLNACCKGLLETTYVHEGQEDSNPSSILFNQKVDFCHRTVRDFLRIPRTHELLLKRLPEDFDAEVVICHALLAQIKISPPERALFDDKGPLYRLVRLLLDHTFSLEDESIPTQSEVELVDQLSATLQTQIETVGQEFFYVFPADEKFAFLSLCVEAGLARYVSQALEITEPRPSPLELSVLLRNASKDGSCDGLGSRSQQRIIQNLLEKAADPNACRPDCESAWIHFLNTVTRQYNTISGERQSVAYSILKEFIEYGAVFGSYDWNSPQDPTEFQRMVEGVLPPEEIEALVRIWQGLQTKQKAEKDDLKGIRRVKGFFKSLKRHGRST